VIIKSSTGELVRVPGRLVIFGIGAVPNTSLFKGKLTLTPRGFIQTDGHLRTR
jgi:thioredoxin reductase